MTATKEVGGDAEDGSKETGFWLSDLAVTDLTCTKSHLPKALEVDWS